MRTSAYTWSGFSICLAMVCIIEGRLSAQDTGQFHTTPAEHHAPATCPVTIANDVGMLGRIEPGVYGNSQVSVGTWPKGVVVFDEGGHGFRTHDGGLGIKFGWRRGVRGRLNITGRRLDEAAKPRRAHVNTGQGDFGHQSTYVVFPTTGCWEITGRVGNASLTFVTWVVQVGTGPRAYDADL